MTTTGHAVRATSSTMPPYRLVALALAAALTGCAGYQTYRQGKADLAEGKLEAGIAKLKQATEQDPNNTEYRRNYFTERDNAVNALMRQIELAMEAGAFDAARQAQAQILKLDPASARASAALARIDAAERHWTALEDGIALARRGDVDGAVAKTQQVVSENPSHRRAYWN